MDDQLAVADGGVDVGEVPDGVAGGAGDERQVGQAWSPPPPASGPRCCAGPARRPRSRPPWRSARGARPPSRHHVLAGDAPDAVERHRRVALPQRDQRRGPAWPGAARAAAAGGLGAALAAGGGGGSGGGGAGRAPGPRRPRRQPRHPRRSARSTSLRVTRPPGPVPWMRSTSRPWSLTRRRTIGERSRPSPPAPLPSPAPVVRRHRRARAGAAAGAGVGLAGARPGAGRLGRWPAARPPPSAEAGAGALGGRRGGGVCPSPADDAPPAPGAVTDHRQHGADVDGLALGHADLGQEAAPRRTAPRSRPCRSTPRRAPRPARRVADLLEPLGDGAFGDGLTELGHDDVGHGSGPWSVVPL